MDKLDFIFSTEEIKINLEKQVKNLRKDIVSNMYAGGMHDAYVKVISQLEELLHMDESECKYCKNTDEEIIPLELPKEIQDADNLVAYTYFNGDLDVWDFENVKQDTFLINYCPMCGRKLR